MQEVLRGGPQDRFGLRESLITHIEKSGVDTALEIR